MGGTRGKLVPARESAERKARVVISAEMTARQGRITQPGVKERVPEAMRKRFVSDQHLRRDDSTTKRGRGIFSGISVE